MKQLTTGQTIAAAIAAGVFMIGLSSNSKVESSPPAKTWLERVASSKGEVAIDTCATTGCADKIVMHAQDGALLSVRITSDKAIDSGDYENVKFGVIWRAANGHADLKEYPAHVSQDRSALVIETPSSFAHDASSAIIAEVILSLANGDRVKRDYVLGAVK